MAGISAIFALSGICDAGPTPSTFFGRLLSANTGHPSPLAKMPLPNEIDYTEPGESCQQAITEFRSSPSSECRLVHYVGVDKPNAKGVAASEVEAEVIGCRAQGFYVDCLYKDGRLFILVQEPGCPIPSWQQVMNEEAIMDVDCLLEAARRRGEL